MKINKNDKVLFIGDSITDISFNKRFNRTIKGKNVYALQVSKEIKRLAKSVKFYYKGIASNRTYHLYDRLTKDCVNLEPDKIIMLIGVNDAWENYVPEQYPPLTRPMEPHLKEIFRRIKCELPNTEVLVLLPFLIDSVKEKLPFHKILDEFREKIENIAKENSAEIVDLQKVFDKAQTICEPKLLAIDGIHPTNLGHKVIAKEVLNKIEY